MGDHSIAHIRGYSSLTFYQLRHSIHIIASISFRRLYAHMCEWMKLNTKHDEPNRQQQTKQQQ